MGIQDELTVASIDSFSGGHWWRTPMTDPLFSSLIKNESFKRQFVERFVEMADTIFAYENVAPLIEQYAEQYVEAAVVSHLRYDDREYFEEDYYAKVEEVDEFFEQRRDYIVEYMKINLEIDDLEAYLQNMR